MRFLRKIYNLLARGCSGLQYISAAALFFGATIVFVEVVARQFHRSLFNLDELCGIAMLIVTVALAGMAFREGRHIRINIMLQRLPDKIRAILELFLGILATGFSIYLAYLWWEMSYAQFVSKTYFLVTGIPKWTVQIVVMLSWAALIFATLEYVVARAKAIPAVFKKF